MAALTLVTPEALMAALGMPTGAAVTPAVAEATEAANGWLTAYLTADDPTDSHEDHAWDRMAALEIAVNMYQSSKAAGGQAVGIDGTPAPYTMGASLLRRVAGLIGPCRDVRGMVG